MQLIRFVRALVPVVMLGLAGSLLGCSDSGALNPPPPDKETSKKIAEEFKAAKKAEMAARRQAAKRAGGPR